MAPRHSLPLSSVILESHLQLSSSDMLKKEISMGSSIWETKEERKESLSDTRGRNASKPSEVPAKGWKDVLFRIKDAINEDLVSTNAAAMAYYIFLAIVPALTSLVLIYAWIADPSEIQEHFSKISEIVPVEITDIINEQLVDLSSKNPGNSLGFGALFALFFALWSASKGNTAFMDALNVIYGEKSERGFIKKSLLAIGMTFIGTIMGLLAIGVIVFYPNVIDFFPLPQIVKTVAGVGSWVILLALFSGYLSFCYRFGPERKKAKWRWVSWGSTFAAFSWALVSAGFSWYASEFGNFNKTYGSMAAIVVLMMWLYISSFVILIGAEINAELEHQTAKDTTKSPEEPLGERGAYVADTVGRPQGKDAHEDQPINYQ